MKKPALLLCLFLVLQVLPAQAAMIVNDHFDGSDLSSSWGQNPSPNFSGWNYQIADSQIIVNDINAHSGSTWAVMYLSQQFNPIDDFNAEFSFSWEEPNSNTIMDLGLRLFDADLKMISAIYFNDAWLGGLGRKTIRFGDTLSHHGNLPLGGSATASMVREDGTVNYYWNGNLLASKQLLEQATSLELSFGYHPYGGQSPMGTMSVDYVTLEGDPVDLSATPEPSTLVLVGLALVLGAWWQCWSKKRIA